jgi:hypothetical protein
MPDDNLQITRTTEFQLNVEMKLQQEPGVLYPLGKQGDHAGSTGVQLEDQFGTLRMTEISDRWGKTQINDIDVIRRWVFKAPRAAVAVPIDIDDMLSTKVTLDSPIVEAQAAAAGRYHDGQWLKGFYGNARTGQEGATVTPFSPANIIEVNYLPAGASGPATGMTYDKLVAVRALIRKRFGLRNKMGMRPTIIVTADDISQMLRINEVKDSDFNSPQWVKDVEKLQTCQEGEVHSFMGFDFLPAEINNTEAYGDAALLTVDGNGYRRVPVHVPGGTHFGKWLTFEGHVDRVSGNNHNWQISGYACSAATRLREDRCFQILCAGA